MFQKVYDLADRFGAIDAVCNVLLSQPDKAATKLADVLDELAKTAAALDDEMVRYLSLHFHSEENNEQAACSSGRLYPRLGNRLTCAAARAARGASI